MSQIDSDLTEEINFMIDLLSESGFFDIDEIIEILEDQFIEYEIDFSNFNISLNESSNENFYRLENVFVNLASDGIIAVHNCGYDIREGVSDVFELQMHLKNNKFNPQGFCFYTFEDVEDAVFDKNLKITFGDFENNEDHALKIGKTVSKYLKEESFNIVWDETVNNQIEINPFVWDKCYNNEKEYEIEGAYEVFTNNQVLK